MKLKICGITNKDDALNAISLGADAIGLIFYDKSPRSITVEEAEKLTFDLPSFVTIVGVFVNETKEKIKEITDRCKLDLIQLHGEESPSFCQAMPRRVIKAFTVKELEDIHHIPAYKGFITAALLDTKVDGMVGGTGKTFDWGIALRAKEYDIPVILAGGINIDNIEKASQLIFPYAVDLSSSVESEPGKKDYNKLEKIISLAKTL